MAEELWNDIHNMALGSEEPELFIPYEAYVSVIAHNRRILIGRPLNPKYQNLQHLISTMLSI